MNKQLKHVKKLLKKMKLIDVLFVLAIIMILYHFLSNRNESFEDYTPSGNEVNFVLFYAEWCPHCQRFEPTWDKLENQLNGTNMNGQTVHIQKIDCAMDENSEKCAANGVNGYPTIKCFTQNGVKEYDGKRDLESLKTYLHDTTSNL
mgnify:FL=1